VPSKSSSNLGSINHIHQRANQKDQRSNEAVRHPKFELKFIEDNEPRLSEREKESVHLSMLDIATEEENQDGKDTYLMKSRNFPNKCNDEPNRTSVVRRGTSITASSKPTFVQDYRNSNPFPIMGKCSTKSRQQSKLHTNGKLVAARKSSTGSRDSGAASSLEADSSGGFNSFLSTMTAVSSLGSSGIGEAHRDTSLSNKESSSPSPDPEMNKENNVSRLKVLNSGRRSKRVAKSVNTPHRDDQKHDFNNKAVTKIKITSNEDNQTETHPTASNSMPISTTNVKLIQNRFTQQVQNLSNNFCDSGLGTPNSLIEAKFPSSGINHHDMVNGAAMISNTPNGKMPSSHSSSRHTSSLKGSFNGYAMKGCIANSNSSSSSKWKSSMSGKHTYLHL
jgi:hypothetical protein